MLATVQNLENNTMRTTKHSFSLSILLICFLSTFSIAQSSYSHTFLEAHAAQGYAIEGNAVLFIFDRALYPVKANQISVTGKFRGWDSDLAKKEWHLKPVLGDRFWLLKVENADYKTVGVKTPFKFRTEKGDWLSPPHSAPNQKDGNLIFAHTVKLLRVKSEVVSGRDIRIIFMENAPKKLNYNPQNYVLKNHTGQIFPIERVLYHAPGQLQLIPYAAIDKTRFHTLTIMDLQKTMPVRYDGWFRTLYSGKEMGANYDKTSNSTAIRLFAPRAKLVKLYLYTSAEGAVKHTYTMKQDENGVWEYILSGNWEGWYYDFTAHGADEPGNRFYSTIKKHFSDPWARVSVDSWGRARIWPKMEPATPLKKGIPKLQDVVSYEVHVQDFTMELPLADSLKGTFKGFVTPGLKNKAGAAVGFDHLVNLGINTVHLMPVQEYLHYNSKEWQQRFGNHPYFIAQEIDKENYQWGYRTSHAFAIETRFAVKGTEYGAQNADFRDLVQAFHNKGIAVIVDLVFNHTAEKMDSRMDYLNFSAIDLPYYYRTDEDLNFLGEYGTETKSEERPMMQRWIIEQCTDLVNQYGVDGFRIDLAGQTDEQTLLALRAALGPDIIIYGEPWIASADPAYEENPDWDWYKIDSPITFFQDDSRNAFKGKTSNPNSKATDRGYAGGLGNREEVKQALSAGFKEDKTALSGINYLDIHDNWALADRFATHNWDGRKGVDEAPFKLAATMLFSSVGPIVLHGGTEFMRSKGSAPLVALVLDNGPGKVYIHGKRDSYNLAKANRFVWSDLGYNRSDGKANNYAQMHAFWQGLITLRNSAYGAVFRIAHKPQKGYYRWLEPANNKALGYLVDEKVLVLLNTDKEPISFGKIALPAGNWIKVGDINGVDITNPLGRLNGGQAHSFNLAGESMVIWVKELEK